jgi:membrane protein
VNRPVRSLLARAAVGARRYAHAVWARDRAAMGGWEALRNRLLRIAIWTVRGIYTHRLSLEAAALTYYTIFSLVPVLVVLVWALKALHLLPLLLEAAPKLPADSSMLHAAVRTIMSVVERAGRTDSGVAGLLALCFAAFKMFRHVEGAIDHIANARERPPVYWRMLGFLALLLFPLVLLLVIAVVTAFSTAAEETSVGRKVAQLVAALPLLRSATGAGIGLGSFGLGIAIFYASAARARIRFGSAAVGGLLAAAVLLVMTWAFVRFQIGVAHASLVAVGVAALPVFLLWSFAAWYVVLVGAEIAVAHDLDRTLRHGARTWSLSPAAEEAAAIALLIEVARSPAAPTTAELARTLRLLPATVRGLAVRLAAGGFLRRAAGNRVALACDPQATTLGDVLDAISGLPRAGAGYWAVAAVRGAGPSQHVGPSLGELADGV